MQYWDTSTLAKLYVSELDSAQFAPYADLHRADVLIATDTNMRKCAAAIGLKLYP